MPINLASIKNELFPGLAAVVGRYRTLPSGLFVPQAPHVWIPKLTLPEAVAVGAAAAIIQNPVVMRRFWTGWFK